ncbi:hypothetical protein D3C77_467660 [compost metagenome]
MPRSDFLVRNIQFACIYVDLIHSYGPANIPHFGFTAYCERLDRHAFALRNRYRQFHVLLARIQVAVEIQIGFEHGIFAKHRVQFWHFFEQGGCLLIVILQDLVQRFLNYTVHGSYGELFGGCRSFIESVGSRLGAKNRIVCVIESADQLLQARFVLRYVRQQRLDQLHQLITANFGMQMSQAERFFIDFLLHFFHGNRGRIWHMLEQEARSLNPEFLRLLIVWLEGKIL